jgi:hypothetical protein
LRGLLRRRGECRAALRGAAGYDSAEVIARAVPNMRGRKRLMATHRRMAASGDFQISSEGGVFSFVYGTRVSTRKSRLGLLQLPELSPDGIHLMDLIGHCSGIEPSAVFGKVRAEMGLCVTAGSFARHREMGW